MEEQNLERPIVHLCTSCCTAYCLYEMPEMQDANGHPYCIYKEEYVCNSCSTFYPL